MPDRPSWDLSEPAVFHVDMKGCPIQASLGVLGRKWALIVLRDVAFFHRFRFSDILRANEDLTARVLSRRLKELVKEGLLERSARVEGGNEVLYRLTEKGGDAIPILSAYFQYGAKYHAKKVFTDSKPHTLRDVFPGQEDFILGDLRGYAVGRGGARSRG